MGEGAPREELGVAEEEPPAPFVLGEKGKDAADLFVGFCCGDIGVGLVWIVCGSRSCVCESVCVSSTHTHTHMHARAHTSATTAAQKAEGTVK